MNTLYVVKRWRKLLNAYNLYSCRLLNAYNLNSCACNKEQEYHSTTSNHVNSIAPSGERVRTNQLMGMPQTMPI